MAASFHSVSSSFWPKRLCLSQQHFTPNPVQVPRLLDKTGQGTQYPESGILVIRHPLGRYHDLRFWSAGHSSVLISKQARQHRGPHWERHGKLPACPYSE